MNVLAMSGSLRAASVNSALLRAAARLAPPGMHIELFRGMGELPLFNFDMDESLPGPVVVLREAVGRADALIIASPEYAHGVSSVMKNALDWLVSYEEFVGKPVVILNAQPRAHFSDTALRETLKTMSASLVESASICLALNSESSTDEGMLRSPTVAGALSTALLALRCAVVDGRVEQGPSFPCR